MGIPMVESLALGITRRLKLIATLMEANLAMDMGMKEIALFQRKRIRKKGVSLFNQKKKRKGIS